MRQKMTTTAPKAPGFLTMTPESQKCRRPSVGSRWVRPGSRIYWIFEGGAPPEAGEPPRGAPPPRVDGQLNKPPLRCVKIRVEKLGDTLHLTPQRCSRPGRLPRVN
eukprot:gene25543-biopygen20999